MPITPILHARVRLSPLWSAPLLARQLSCLVFGHHVDNRLFARGDSSHRRCTCGREYLVQDGTETRVRHTLSCFFFGHNYTYMTRRDGHLEYACSRCGHPLLIAIDDSENTVPKEFHKRVRYRCGLFGHRVHTVVERHGWTEYACHLCGHSFLAQERGRSKVLHPLVCILAGHYISFVEMRNGYAEHRCRHCGHTFCFVSST